MLVPRSPLSLLLLRSWAEGSFSATDVQEIALGSPKTPQDAGDLKTLANPGAMGNQPEESRGGLEEKVLPEYFNARALQSKDYWVWGAENGKKQKMFPILLAHLWIQAM